MKNCIKEIQNNYTPIKNGMKYYQHINFLNISRRPDILEQILNIYNIDIIIINFKNNLNFRESCI